MTINYLLKGSKGGGGGGGGGSAPVRTPDSLRSKDTVEVVLALGEGPQFGLENGAKSFYVGDTLLQNANGEYNFKTFVLKFFPGNDVADKIIPILGGQASNTPVNLPLAYMVPAVRTSSSVGNIDYLEVRLAFQRLLKSDDTGTYKADAYYKIEYKPTSSATWIVVTGDIININGKTTSTYIKEHRWNVPRIAGAYDIRVTKYQIDNTDTLFCDMAWESFQEVRADEVAYNNTACIQLSGEASDQFTNIPTWSGIYKGMIIKVPTNYNPETRVYSGVWDGTWKLAYSNNPAWCLYDFVMNDRYGIRSYYLEMNMDKYDVYDAARWCDELVPDGKGGTQPRYTLNLVLTEATPGKELARYMAGVFNATFFDDLNGKAFLRVDKDDDAQHIFMKENVTTDGFSYTYTDITTRYNDLTVTFLNPELDWEQDRRRVYDQAKIDKYGRIPFDFIAVGCIDEHEALRRGHYKMITSNTETCIIKFTSNRLASMVNPFEVILICDPDMGYGISGRIKGLNPAGDTALLRDPVYLEVGVEYKATFTMNDGSKFTAPLADVYPGYNTVLKFDDVLPENLPERAAFALEAEGVIGLPRPFRVTQVEEMDGSIDAYTISAININRNKWHDADNLTDIGVIDYSALPSPINPPGPVTCTFEERFVKEKKRFEITVNPIFNRGKYKYYTNDHSFEVWSRPAGTNEEFVPRTLMYGDTMIDHPPGNFEFRVLGISYLGYRTQVDTAPSFIFNVTNPKDAPKNIDWIKINKREVYWGYANAPDDFDGFILRYHNVAGRTSWDDAQQPHQGVISATSFYTNLIPPSARVIMVRAVDAFGIVSDNSAIIYRELGDITATNIIQQIDMHPTWTGTLIGCAIDGGYIKANDTGTQMYSGTPTAQFYDGGLLYSATYNELYYQGSLTTIAPGSLVVNIDFDGAGYELSYRNSGDTIWTQVPDRAELAVGTYDFLLRIFGGPVRGIVRHLSFILDANEIITDVQDVPISSGGTRITIPTGYTTLRVVSAVIQDTTGTNTAVGYRVIDKNPTLGPLIKLVDAAGTFVSGNIDVTIRGF